ncbi:hypothetical protein [Winogradskyella aquimaris]|uniref:DUF5723 domain-containing protein n=1 Tax=Winogradskyella aquimaris TaxID=864074 RepID=A0ABU5EPX7_9FLAO|nr:hypothetical protein [Winogradskyella aquimaris]MDY2588402.1 hypothetical protein [Winogradskyella aquimaris]
MCLLLISSICSFSQDLSKTIDINNSIKKVSVVSTHPFGIFFSRWQGNFQSKPLGEYNLNINLESGNVWSPPVTAYIPNNVADREFISTRPWHVREFIVDVDTLDAKTLEVQNDGVIKGLRINLNIPINTKSELKVGLRSFLLTRGKFPFSLITNDDTIEYFHENIAGGKDPFDRQLYPLNKARIRYKDRRDQIMDINNGDFILSGFEFSYYRYPKVLIAGLDFNYGTHIGINTSRFNASLDIGASVNLRKSIELNTKDSFDIGLSIGGTKNNLLNFQSDNIDFSSNTFIGYFETLVQFSFLSKSKRTRHSFATDFYFQTSLNNKNEFDYIIPTKNGTSFKSWNSGISNLYRNNNYWTLMYSLTKKMTTTFYIQQDLTVNNNPDIQTGICVSFGL